MSDKKAKPAGKAAPAGKTAAKDSKGPARGSVPPPAQKAKAPGGPASKRKGGAVSARAVAPVDAAPAPVVTPSDAQKEHGFRRKIIGIVVGDKMNKTVVVEVIRKAMHPMYKKYVRVRNKYKAHDETNSYKVGDRVEIMEHRPISAHKRWLVTRLVSRPVEA